MNLSEKDARFQVEKKEGTTLLFPAFPAYLAYSNLLGAMLFFSCHYLLSKRTLEATDGLPPPNHRLALQLQTLFVIWGEPRSAGGHAAAVVIADVVFPPRHMGFLKYLFFFFSTAVSAGEEASSWAGMKESNELGKSECFGRVE